MKIENYTLKKILLIITFTVVLLLGLQHFDAVMDTIKYIIRLFIPFIIGACMAFIINLPVRFLEKKIFPKIHCKLLEQYHRSISITLSLLFIVCLMGVVSVLIVPEFIDKVGILLNTSSSFIEKIGNYINSFAQDNPQLQEWLNEINPNWSEIGRHVTTYIQDFFNTIFTSAFTIISSIINGLMNFMISFMFSLYFISHKEQFSNQGRQILYAYLNKNWATKIHQMLTLINDTFSSFITGQCTEAVIQFVMFFSLLTLLNYPYALLISIFIAFMSFIPIVGSYISSYTSAFLILMTDPWKALLFLVLFMVVQQFDSSFIYPKVVGNSVGLPPILVIVAVTIGGRLLGIIGMLTFIPITSILYSLIRGNVKKRLAKKDINPANL